MIGPRLRTARTVERGPHPTGDDSRGDDADHSRPYS